MVTPEGSRLGQARATVDALVRAARTRDRAGFELLISNRDPTFPDRARMLRPEDVAEAVLLMAALPARASLEDVTLLPAGGIL